MKAPDLSPQSDKAAVDVFVKYVCCVLTFYLVLPLPCCAPVLSCRVPSGQLRLVIQTNNALSITARENSKKVLGLSYYAACVNSLQPHL